MRLIEKHELYFFDYIWKKYPRWDRRVYGMLDETVMDRGSGYEVFYFVNKLAENWDLKRKESGRKIERMIRKAPPEIQSQIGIKNWIYENWKEGEE